MAGGSEGAAQLRRVGRSLKDAGRGGLHRELLRGFRKVGDPLIAKIKANALGTLPSSGGLAAQVAGSRFATHTRTTGTVGVRIVASNQYDLDAIDQGIVRHPVFGGRRWVQQPVGPGWFSKPAEGDLPTVRRGVQKVMDDVAAKIERSA